MASRNGLAAPARIWLVFHLCSDRRYTTTFRALSSCCRFRSRGWDALFRHLRTAGARRDGRISAAVSRRSSVNDNCGEEGAFSSKLVWSCLKRPIDVHIQVGARARWVRQRAKLASPAPAFRVCDGGFFPHYRLPAKANRCRRRVRTMHRSCGAPSPNGASCCGSACWRVRVRVRSP